MSVRRLLFALGLAGVLAVVGWLLWDVPEPGRGDSGPHGVRVEGPGNSTWNTTVQVPDATALSVLLAAGEALNFTVDVEDRAGFGGRACSGIYVVGIGGHRETASGGWDYHVRAAGGEWEWQPHGAACHPLRPGDDVRWVWVEG